MPGSPATATIMFTDLVGSTALRVALGEERADSLRRVHDELLGQRIDSDGGRVVKGGGDGLLAAFGSASAALAAAVHIQQAIAAYNRRADRLAQLSVRIGLSVGDVLWEGGDCFGTPVVEAARLEALAAGGQILCTDLVRLLAHGRGDHEFVAVGELELKGLPEPALVFEVRWTGTAAPVLPLPSGVLVPTAGPFVGRAAEITEAAALLDDTTRAAPSMVWLAGEPGIGKTRLAAELAGRQYAAGWAVLFGRCDEALQLPFQPFAEALRHVCAHSGDHHLAEVFAGGVAPELARLCPDLRRRLPAAIAEPSEGREQDQFRLFEAIRLWLSATAIERPVLLVLDDVHWGTTPTLLLLNYLARTLEDGRVALLATLRDTECPDVLRAIVDESTLRPGGLHIRLGGLARNEVAALTGDVVSTGELYAQTGGNPLFVRALLATGDRGATLEAAIRRRVTRLPGPVQELLRLAALAGLEFDLRILACAERIPIDQLLEPVEAAVRAGLLEEAGANRCRFAHGLVRDALDRQIGAARRVLGHRALAEAYEQRLPGEVTALARHWSEAADDPATIERAITALTAAGDAAESASDHDGAARAYHRALELLGDEPTPAHAQLRYVLGRARLEGGYRTADTEQLLLDAARLAGRFGLDEIRIDATSLAGLVGAVFGRASPQAVQAVAELVKDPPGDPRLLARVNALRACHFEWIGESESAVSAGLEAVAEAEAVGDAVAISWALNAVAGSLPYERAKERLDYGWGRPTGDPQLAKQLGGHYRLTPLSALLALGDLATAESLLADAAGEAERRRDPVLQHVVAVTGAVLALLRGDLVAAEASADTAERIADHLEGIDVSGLDGVLRFSIRREQGRLAEVAPAMRLLARLNPVGAWRPGLAAVYADLGMLAEAAVEVERVVVGSVVDVPVDQRRPLTVSYLADAVAATADVAKAAVLYDLMRPWAGLNITMYCVACYGPVHRYLGMLAFTMGELDRAEGHLQDSLAQCSAMGTPVYEAHTHYWLARVAQRRGDKAALERAVNAARELAGRIGMAGLTAHLHALDGGC